VNYSQTVEMIKWGRIVALKNLPACLFISRTILLFCFYNFAVDGYCAMVARPQLGNISLSMLNNSRATISFNENLA